MSKAKPVLIESKEPIVAEVVATEVAPPALWKVDGRLLPWSKRPEPEFSFIVNGCDVRDELIPVKAEPSNNENTVTIDGQWYNLNANSDVSDLVKYVAGALTIITDKKSQVTLTEGPFYFATNSLTTPSTVLVINSKVTLCAVKGKNTIENSSVDIRNIVESNIYRQERQHHSTSLNFELLNKSTINDCNFNGDSNISVINSSIIKSALWSTGNIHVNESSISNSTFHASDIRMTDVNIVDLSYQGPPVYFLPKSRDMGRAFWRKKDINLSTWTDFDESGTNNSLVVTLNTPFAFTEIELGDRQVTMASLESFNHNQPTALVVVKNTAIELKDSDFQSKWVLQDIIGKALFSSEYKVKPESQELADDGLGPRYRRNTTDYHPLHKSILEYVVDTLISRHTINQTLRIADRLMR